MSNDLWSITYEQARAAYETGQKLHLGQQVCLVRRALRGSEEGLLLYPDGSAETR